MFTTGSCASIAYVPLSIETRTCSTWLLYSQINLVPVSYLILIAGVMQTFRQLLTFQVEGLLSLSIWSAIMPKGTVNVRELLMPWRNTWPNAALSLYSPTRTNDKPSHFLRKDLHQHLEHTCPNRSYKCKKQYCRDPREDFLRDDCCLSKCQVLQGDLVSSYREAHGRWMCLHRRPLQVWEHWVWHETKMMGHGITWIGPQVSPPHGHQNHPPVKEWLLQS